MKQIREDAGTSLGDYGVVGSNPRRSDHLTLCPLQNKDGGDHFWPEAEIRLRPVRSRARDCRGPGASCMPEFDQETLSARFNTGEAEAIRQMADRAGTSIASLIRGAVLNAPESPLAGASTRAGKSAIPQRSVEAFIHICGS